MRGPAAKIKPRLAKTTTFPAPVGGWISNVNLASPDARRPDGSKVNGAYVLDNWFATATSIRMRGGSEQYAKIGDGQKDVTVLFTYINGNNRKFFGATEAAVYDITTVAYPQDQFLTDPDGLFTVDDDGKFVIIDASPDPVVSSLSGGDWSVVQFATAGGTFLRAVNGVDTPLVFDGTDWDTSPAITGATPETLSFVWSFKNRLFFIQKDTLDAWYLDTDEIGGAATKFPLGGVFTRGGSLLFGASWSLDENSGLSASCAFFTTEGEVAVYKGNDPATAETWSLVGVYRIGRPRGPKAFIRAGGDLVIATDIGFVPLSQAITRDVAALSPAAVSYSIEVAWNEIVADRSDVFWHCAVWPTKQMVLIGFPATDESDPVMLVANARTGAWSRFTGWQANCLEVFGDRGFFGSIDGRIIEAEATGADRGAAYTATCVPLFDPLKTPASLKTGVQARSIVRAPAPISVQLSLQTDFNVNLPSAPDDTNTASASVWGTGIWGQSKWSSPASKQTYARWQSVAGGGYLVSVASQITSGSVQIPDVELVETDLSYDLGEVGS